MNPTRFPREYAQVKGNVFIISPFGPKVLTEGEPPHDFDDVIRDVIAPAITSVGMTPVRADWIYGPQSVMEGVWRGIQQAELVVVDFTGKAPNVSLEFALAAVIGKRMVFLTQNKDDIPTDIQGVRYITYSTNYKAMNKMAEELVSHLEAIRGEPAADLGFTAFGRGGTEPAPGRVFAVQREVVTIKTDDGRYGVLGQADVDWGRLIPDMSKLFRDGDRIDGAFDTETMKYTLIGDQPNPWPSIEAEYDVGTRFTGVVQNKLGGVGAFVKIAGPVKGLLPEASTPEVATLDRGDSVEVIVTRLDPGQRKVQLRLARRLESERPTPPETAAPITGTASLAVGMTIDDAEVIKALREGDKAGGYILVSLPPSGQRAMLHCTAMSAELRADLNAGQVERGELLTVVIDRIDHDRGRIAVHDVPELEDEENTAA